MIIVLYGPDSYRARQKLKSLIVNYRVKNKTGVNLRYFNANNFDFEEFKNIFKSGTIFAEKKLVVLDGVLAGKKTDKDAWLEFVKKMNLVGDGAAFLMMLEEKLPAGKLKKFLTKPPIKVQEFEKLSGAALARWIKSEFDARGVLVRPQGIKKLMDWFGGDTWRLANEIAKLASYKKTIDAKEVEEMTSPLLEPDIFAAIDALGNRNKARALEIFHEHLARGQSPQYLLSMVAYQFRNIASVKAGAKVKLHPFVLRKTRLMAQKFDKEEIKKIYSSIFEIDLAIKSGRASAEAALDRLIISI